MSTTTITTGKIRLSYAHLFEATSMNENDAKKFSTSILIPKKDKKTVKAIEDAIAAAKEDGKSKKFGGKIPANLRTPLRDGDDEKPEDENYKGMYFLNCSSVKRPKVVDGDRNEILDTDEVYSGCFGRVNLNFYPYNFENMSKGIAAGLNAFQKLEDGEQLGGGCTDVEAAFGDDLADEL